MAQTITFDDNLPETTEAVRAILIDAMPERFNDGFVGTSEVMGAMAKFNDEGPYCMAKRLGLLIDNSAEDMSIEFMSFCNKMFSNAY